MDIYTHFPASSEVTDTKNWRMLKNILNQRYRGWDVARLVEGLPTMHPQHCLHEALWCTPVIFVLGRLTEKNLKLTVLLGHILSG